MIATIVPRQHGGGAMLATQGMQVEVAPGVYLNGVTRIELHAEVNDVWRATITCCVAVQPIKARVRLRLPRPALLYRRGGRAIWRK